MRPTPTPGFALLLLSSLCVPACNARGEASGRLPRPALAGPAASKFDAAAAAAGLRPLRSTPLPAGEREVRVWIEGGLGYPGELYRIRPSTAATEGELINYWPVDRDSTLRGDLRYERVMRYYQRGTCGGVHRRGRWEACRVRFTRPPDWDAALRAAEAGGLWSLPDEADLPERRLVIDGWRARVEVRSGREYRAYEYGSPDRKPWPEATRMMQIVTALEREGATLARPAAVERVWRGIYAAGPSLREFRPCGSRARYHLDGQLAAVPGGWVDAPGEDTVRHPILRRYVVLRGTLEPEAVAAANASERPRQLTVLEVLAVAAPSPLLCALR